MTLYPWSDGSGSECCSPCLAPHTTDFLVSRRLYRQKLGARTRVLLISITLATTQALAQGQQLSAPQQTPSAPSAVAPEKSGENQTAPLEHGSLDQKAGSSSSLKVPDIDTSANTKESTVNKESFAYTPLSPHSKFHLYVKQTYSPYTYS
jgi:hypothetical protein